jgi:putative membrane protein
MAAPRPRMHARSPTFPLYHSTRKKPRRWPLVLRFIKGAIHVDIALPVVLHAAWAALIVYIDQVRDDHIGLPSSIIPSLSIVVGLMLVFRNSTSYDRFWQVIHPQICEPLDQC